MKDSLLNRETEEKLLGELAASSMYDQEEARLAALQWSLPPDAFGHPDTRELFTLMMEQLSRGFPVGREVLDHEFKKRGMAPTPWLAQRQMEAVGVPAMLHPLAVELRELASRRRLRDMAREINARALDPTKQVEETLGYLGSSMNRMVSGASAKIETLDVKLEVVARQMAAVGTEAEQTVVKTGLELWDKNVGGLWPTLNVIGGHPSRGKSALAASLILGMAKQGIRGMIFSMEDSAEWLLYRYLARFSRVPGFVMRTRPLDEYQQEAVGLVWEDTRKIARNIMFDERGRLSPQQLVAAAREAILSHGARYIVADHAGEFSYARTRGGDRFDLDIAEGLVEMRSIAKAHGVPFVLLSQLSRSAKPPHTLQDFKNASAIEETARVAAIVWTRDGEPNKPTVSIVKNTNGKRDFDMKFELDEVSGLLVEPEYRAPPGQQETLL